MRTARDAVGRQARATRATSRAAAASRSRSRDSCNSVFAPLGAKLGAKKLVAAAEAFGFNEQPDVPAAKANTIPKATDLKDAIAVGSSAIGQNKDLATPLGMAAVGATIANDGVRVQPADRRARKRAPQPRGQRQGRRPGARR